MIGGVRCRTISPFKQDCQLALACRCLHNFVSWQLSTHSLLHQLDPKVSIHGIMLHDRYLFLFILVFMKPMLDKMMIWLQDASTEKRPGGESNAAEILNSASILKILHIILKNSDKCNCQHVDDCVSVKYGSTVISFLYLLRKFELLLMFFLLVTLIETDLK